MASVKLQWLQSKNKNFVLDLKLFWVMWQCVIRVCDFKMEWAEQKWEHILASVEVFVSFFCRFADFLSWFADANTNGKLNGNKNIECEYVSWRWKTLLQNKGKKKESFWFLCGCQHMKIVLKATNFRQFFNFPKYIPNNFWLCLCKFDAKFKIIQNGVFEGKMCALKSVAAIVASSHCPVYLLI